MFALADADEAAVHAFLASSPFALASSALLHDDLDVVAVAAKLFQISSLNSVFAASLKGTQDLTILTNLYTMEGNVDALHCIFRTGTADLCNDAGIVTALMRDISSKNAFLRLAVADVFQSLPNLGDVPNKPGFLFAIRAFLRLEMSTMKSCRLQDIRMLVNFVADDIILRKMAVRIGLFKLFCTNFHAYLLYNYGVGSAVKVVTKANCSTFTEEITELVQLASRFIMHCPVAQDEASTVMDNHCLLPFINTILDTHCYQLRDLKAAALHTVGIALQYNKKNIELYGRDTTWRVCEVLHASLHNPEHSKDALKVMSILAHNRFSVTSFAPIVPVAMAVDAATTASIIVESIEADPSLALVYACACTRVIAMITDPSKKEHVLAILSALFNGPGLDLGYAEVLRLAMLLCETSGVDLADRIQHLSILRALLELDTRLIVSLQGSILYVFIQALLRLSTDPVLNSNAVFVIQLADTQLADAEQLLKHRCEAMMEPLMRNVAHTGLVAAMCTVCLSEDTEPRVYLPCLHGFHPDCVHQWLYRHDTCPACRATIIFSAL